MEAVLAAFVAALTLSIGRALLSAVVTRYLAARRRKS
jgi:hypothetical protein